jgi:hypothetical protein
VSERGTCFTIALNGFADTFAECIDTQRAYCARHGYTYLVFDRLPWKITARQSAWLKVELLRGLVSAGEGGAVAFLDADCEVRAHTPAFESAFSDKPLMLAKGKSGRLNSGVIFARRARVVRDFLDLLIQNSDESVPEESRTRYENGHFIHFGAQSDIIGLLDHAVWNNNSKMDEESFIQHFSGGDLRKLFMRERAPLPTRVDGVKGYIHRFSEGLKPDRQDLAISSFLELARRQFEPSYLK